MTKRRTLIVAAALAPLAAFALAAGHLDDTAQVKQMSKDFAAAWNKHDAKAISELWARDGDLICPDGKLETGPSGVQTFFGEQFAPNGMMGKSTIDIKKDTVRFITPDVALSDLDCTTTGMMKGDGAEAAGPMMNHVVVISKKEGGQWKIAAARPEHPVSEGEWREKGAEKGKMKKTSGD
jgi:uncharacterized protein (TIGR02246 family)